jgi:threonine/homoserine/homoserine lactone efflux protein
MDYISPLFFGFIFAVIGIALPGMVNMTGLSVSIRRGLKAGMLYAAGGTTTSIIQASIAVLFADYISNNIEELSYQIRIFSIVLFIVLAALFFYQARNPRPPKTSKHNGPAFFLGMLVAGLNGLYIPYFFAIGTMLKAQDLVVFEYPYYIMLIIGISLGIFTVLSGYAYFAEFIKKRATFLVSHLNYFLAGFFLILAAIQLV